MSLTSEATTVWTGDLKSGSGTLTLDSSHTAEFEVSWAARSEGRTGVTNPEELLGAAHSSCFSMKFSADLASFGTPPESIQVTAAVTFDPAEGITGSRLLVNARVPGISEADFQRLAEESKKTCPVSRALVGIPITIEANLA
ncbi:MAG: lipoyl-dependent peroxiredoxin [Microbacteriaceae bacterium]|jgi:osmotically inducible protein OsmC|nr:OsmC family peroxiredoxin [Leifsonia sp.]MDQ1580853.1 lipoyl-dependent peroxiredoxin [Microbacteriaceae bacterium]MDQ1586899.1 lipoyl-dependent peroxiredoxin [Microbacteriaceae bacterium]HEV7564711.1 OsmC family peroxiredoxin [Microbacteriaceae bacterium]